MKYTNKQRAEIYLDATERISYPINGCCWAIQDVIDDSACTVNSKQILKDFPEFALFQPGDVKPNKYWFGSPLDDDNQNCRILALLFAHQIALNP